MSETITFGSVCSGIEAASVAWKPLGWKAAWLAEIEPAPCAVLAHHYPDVPNLGDMTKIAALVRDGFVPAPDVFCGGTPCQAFSVAGLRQSLDDERGNLSLVFCEIANEIDTRRAATGLLPSIVFWENVPGVLSTSDNAFGCFLAGLAGEDDPIKPAGKKWTNAGCVYGPKRTVAWRVLDAQYFGVPQRRRRVFVVASAREGFDPAEVLFEFDGVRRDTAPSREAGERTSESAGKGSDGRSTFACRGIGSYASDSASATLLKSGQDLGNGCETLVAEIPPLSRCITAVEGKRQEYETCTIIPALSVSLRGREGGATAELGDEVAGCLRASGGGGDKPHVLAPIAFDSRQDPVSSTELFGALGSSSPQAQAVAYAIQAGALRTNPNSGPDGVGVQADHAYTLEARAEVQAVAYSTKLHNTKSNGAGKLYEEYTASLDANSPPPALLHPMAIRRLTTIECARLQGFPDDYLTQVMVRGKPMADGPMYKALGNSWAVPNVRWIGQRIDARLRALSGSITAPQ